MPNEYSFFKFDRVGTEIQLVKVLLSLVYTQYCKEFIKSGRLTLTPNVSIGVEFEWYILSAHSDQYSAR